MKFTQRLSLRVRLTLIFLILASVTWLLSSFVAWKQTTDNVDELFDTQLMLFAKRLSTLDLNEINAADRMAQTPNKLKHGHVDDDALTFAIFTHDGRMVLNDGDNGEDIPYSYQREGFADGQLVGDKDQWRFVWMTSPDGKYRIVVGQEWEYREDMALAIVAGQLIPWLVALPIMLIIMMVLLGRELAPLNKLALALRMRDPDSEKPLNATGVPSEVRPLVESLNQLFARTHAMMVRERRFTSDAAHELRSPLTGEPLPAVVPAGPDNPMGLYALYIGRLYAIHGTNANFGIGLRVSHGCVRLRNEDIKFLFEKVPVGTRVQFIDEPVKATTEPDGSRYIEVHNPLSTTEAQFEGQEIVPITLTKSVQTVTGQPDVDQVVLDEAIKNRSGMPVRLN